MTEPLKEVCQRNPKPDHAFVIGPTLMMKFCCEATRPFGVPTQVSLNTIMVDGTGMCGGCRVEVDGKAKFVCVDGPEFDGHKVNFDLMIKRLNAYKKLRSSRPTRDTSSINAGSACRWIGQRGCDES